MARRPVKIGGSIARGGGVALGEAVFRSLCEALQAGSYRAGDRLREEEVAQRLKVSRTPVREALGRLAARGFVEPAGGRGLIVRNLDISEVLELYAMREIMEGAAARLAAEHASPPEIDALRDIEQAFVETSDAAEMARLNRSFHEAICRAARNRYLDNASRELQDWIALLGPTTFTLAGRPTTSHGEHRKIIDAIAARNGDKAELLARAHIREALRCRLKLLQKQ
ncbi:GntR family transcriptional regulator [Bradyrhizobium daqingense]|uniref:DNA-binding GntR family transcriptional regulator n=1 Tax=Bradyrhizobium daqingense TaxID=993502 RepID=A0A562L304_9BRAD|nr:GntR family transcriptional regulator [Bradyrhizobium daqingense]TWI02003.1 DNA-binding GntR family transcriptional regulator [Bradyrhizobium daqingense]UFS88705.1 GntR family transcriptional regulator [Bradyrhizobium daqingense]